MKLLFPGSRFNDMASALFAEEKETCALLIAAPVFVHGGPERLLVQEIHIVPPDQYLLRSAVRAEVKPEFIVPRVALARKNNQSIVFVHTHPASTKSPEFSPTDDAGEKILATFLRNRIPNVPHVAIVISKSGCAARIIGSATNVDVIQIGSSIVVQSRSNGASDFGAHFDRQVRAFGRWGQERISDARVAIVGLGGTGSIVAQQLAHLGTRHLTLVDPDFVEESNLNRLVGARPSDVGRPKVRVAARTILDAQPTASVETLLADIADIATASKVIGADAIFCCTDSHASRAVLNQIAYQYYIPVFDMGVSIRTLGGRVTHMTGRAQMVAPGLACLTCSEIIDAKAVRTELMSPAQRAADPYFIGHHEPQPAVISLNSTVASLAVTMFMSAFAHVPAVARLQYYNAIAGTLRSATVRPDPTCIVCSKSGALGLGNAWPMIGRSQRL